MLSDGETNRSAACQTRRRVPGSRPSASEVRTSAAKVRAPSRKASRIAGCAAQPARSRWMARPARGPLPRASEHRERVRLGVMREPAHIEDHHLLISHAERPPCDDALLRAGGMESVDIHAQGDDLHPDGPLGVGLSAEARPEVVGVGVGDLSHHLGHRARGADERIVGLERRRDQLAEQRDGLGRAQRVRDPRQGEGV